MQSEKIQRIQFFRAFWLEAFYRSRSLLAWKQMYRYHNELAELLEAK